MKAAPACFEQRVCHGWCLLCGSGSNCDTQLLEFSLFKFFMFKSSEGENRGREEGGTGSFININILICAGGREDLSDLAAFNSCCGAVFSLLFSAVLSVSSGSAVTATCLHFLIIVSSVLGLIERHQESCLTTSLQFL